MQSEQTVSLSKKQTVSLTKSRAGLSLIALGLGWSPAKPVKKEGGFFGRIFSSDEEVKEIDLDASCVMMNSEGKVIDTVWFRKHVSNCGAVRHSGDNRTGRGAAGDKETISVDLKKLPSDVVKMAFTVNAFTGQTFNEVEDAYCKVYDTEAGKTLGYFPLAEKGSHTGVFIASVEKVNGEWQFTAQGKACPGRIIEDMIPTIRQEMQ